MEATQTRTAKFSVTFSDDGTEVVGSLSDDAPDIKPMRHDEDDEKITALDEWEATDSRVTLQDQLDSFARGYFAANSHGGFECAVVEYLPNGIAVNFRDADDS